MEKSEKIHHQTKIDFNAERQKFQQEEQFRINIIKDNLKKTGDGKDVVYEDDEED